MLSDEDRRRIEEEERYRAAVRAQIGQGAAPGARPVKERMGCGRAVFIGLALVAAMVVLVNIISNMKNGSSSKSSVPGESEARVDVVLSRGLICGKTQEDMYRIAGGAQQGDLAGVMRMVQSGEALQLKAGTNVTTLMHENSLVLISINSGVHDMTSCWAASANVK